MKADVARAGWLAPVRWRHATMAGAAVAAAACLGVPAGASAAGTQRVIIARASAVGGTWGTAETVPGITAADGNPRVSSISCPAAGNCVAAVNTSTAAFLVSEKDGTWGTAKPIASSQNLAVSCASPGNCAVGGYISGPALTAFVLDETHGTWGSAEQVPGMSGIYALSCPSAGNCSAGGFTTTDVPEPNDYAPYVVDETNGTWGTPEEVPGAATLNTEGEGVVTSLSCASAGNCSAGGRAEAYQYGMQPFVVNETSGTWGTAARLAVHGRRPGQYGAEVLGVSCSSAGNCGADGWSEGGHGKVFAVVETNGAWGTAKFVSSDQANTGPSFAQANTSSSLSCAASDCMAGGYFTGPHNKQAFAVRYKAGAWDTAKVVPGTAALNTGNSAGVNAVSCVSVTCTIGGYYTGSSGQAFVDREVEGTWGTPQVVPGTAALSTGGTAEVTALSCISAGSCSAGGYVTTSSGELPFVVSETNGS